LINNQSISDAATFKAIGEIFDKQSPEVQKELKSVLPYVGAHGKNSFHGGDGNDNRSSAHGNENGKFAHESERGNSAYGRQQNGNKMRIVPNLFSNSAIICFNCDSTSGINKH
jgi:hypothetical protein